MASSSGSRESLFRAAIALPLALALVGCASLDLSRVGEAWARNECLRNPDELSRTRCVDSSGKAYEASRRQATLAKE